MKAVVIEEITQYGYIQIIRALDVTETVIGINNWRNCGMQRYMREYKYRFQRFFIILNFELYIEL